MNSNGEKRRTYPNHKPNKEYKFTLRLYVMRRRGALSMNIEASVCSLYLLSTPSLLKVLSFNFDWQRHKISSVDWQSQKQTIQNTSDVISIVEVLHFTALVLIWSLARLGVTCWAPWLFTHQTFSRVLMFGHLTPHTLHLTPHTSTHYIYKYPGAPPDFHLTDNIRECPLPCHQVGGSTGAGHCVSYSSALSYNKY